MTKKIQVMACNLRCKSCETETQGAPFIPLHLPHCGLLVTLTRLQAYFFYMCMPLSAIGLSVTEMVRDLSRWPLPLCPCKQGAQK